MDCNYDYDFSKYEQAVGPAYAAQQSLKLFIEDKDNMSDKREYALMLYNWLGTSDVTIDELGNITSYANAIFILETMEKYNIITPSTTSNVIMSYSDAIESLRFQIKSIEDKKASEFERECDDTYDIAVSNQMIKNFPHLIRSEPND